ncbi:hypothetical protein GDO86_003708 [Hymenochirus boettgeri]|uniref:Uncharacterized protein n=1 Tax=Hymenochirus boettgeri TaxID=247094 RepID=A0A8T2K633_9PIPI|nr:hypothetical protein GDO86_003708 [Hymenochirus boettgeri]
MQEVSIGTMGTACGTPGALRSHHVHQTNRVRLLEPIIYIGWCEGWSWYDGYSTRPPRNTNTYTNAAPCDHERSCRVYLV